jgi:hypothetical protein
MKFRTFRILALFAGLTTVGGLGYLIFAPGHAPAVVQPPPPSLPPPAPPPPALPPPPQQPSAPVVPEPPAPPRPSSTDATTDRIRAKLEQWLTQHPNRQGKTKLEDILPSESFKATMVRFPEPDASKWSNDPGQWSQVRIDLNRDGHDDEKWLLKNGHTYKRETLDSTGRVVSTQYFK